MYELVTLVLVIYVVGSILRRTAERKREMDRLKARVNQLSEIVSRLDVEGAPLSSEQIVELELRDLQMQLQDFNGTADSAAQTAFEHLHFVEETISKSIFLAPELPTEAESTL